MYHIHAAGNMHGARMVHNVNAHRAFQCTNKTPSASIHAQPSLPLASSVHHAVGAVTRAHLRHTRAVPQPGSSACWQGWCHINQAARRTPWHNMHLHMRCILHQAEHRSYSMEPFVLFVLLNKLLMTLQQTCHCIISCVAARDLDCSICSS
jgi:hypothetical protein